MKNFSLPKKYMALWKMCVPLLKKGRPEDLRHAWDTVQFVLQYRGVLKINKEVIIPVAMLHDIGHSAILSEHLRHVTGPKKFVNGKLVHMLAGAKISCDVLTTLHYPKSRIRTIVDIISIHDIYQMDVDWCPFYDTHDKKVFHDIDLLDQFNAERFARVVKQWPKGKFLKALKENFKSFFFQEFRDIARTRLKNLG